MIAYYKGTKVQCPQKKEGVTMDKESLSVRQIQVHLSFPPNPERYEGTRLHELYVELCKVHAYDHFALLGGASGARMYTDGARELTLQAGRLSLEQRVRAAIDRVEDDVTNIVETVAKQVEIRAFALPMIQLEAIWPSTSHTDIREAIKRKVLSIGGDKFELLAPATLDSAGLTINCSGELKDPSPGGKAEGKTFSSHYNFGISPSSEDHTQLEIDLSAHYHCNLDKPNEVRVVIRDAYNFLWERITAFVQALSIE